MKHRFIIFLMTLTFVAAPISGQEAAKRYELQLGDFSELKVIDGINVDWRCNPDSAGLAVFSAMPHMASNLAFSSKKERLEIRVNLDGAPIPDGLPHVTVYSSRMAKVENSGDSLVRVYSSVSAKAFKAKLIGNGGLAVHGLNVQEVKASLMTGHGTMALTGSCKNASLSITGTGTIEADRLSATNVKCNIIGTGTIGCRPSGRLSIFGMGTGKVYYVGKPASVSSRSIGISAIEL